MGVGHYDFEGWVERKCATCIDGRLGPPQPRRQVPLEAAAAGGDVEERQPRREQKPPDGERNQES